MKKQFFDLMRTVIDTNEDVFLHMAGLGYPRVDESLDAYPERAFNTEASEQTSLDIAVGLAYAGKIPVVYSITPFLLFRAFETIRTYINHEALPVILVGAGRNDDYSKHDGFSHFAGDDLVFLQHFNNLKTHYPQNKEGVEKALGIALARREPSYINLTR